MQRKQSIDWGLLSFSLSVHGNNFSWFFCFPLLFPNFRVDFQNYFRVASDSEKYLGRCSIEVHISWNHFQWRIQDFPEVGTPTLQGPWGRQHMILPEFSKNCMKLKEFGPRGRGGGCPSRLPLISANDFLNLITYFYGSIFYRYALSKQWEQSVWCALYIQARPIPRALPTISRKGKVVGIMAFSVVTLGHGKRIWRVILFNYLVCKTSFPQILLKLGIRALPSTVYLVLYIFLSFSMLASLLLLSTCL